jgi:glutamate N-acetyltransferase/amino-acid N-acetyltransferase
MAQPTMIVVPRGFRAGAVKAGIKPSGGLDMAVLVADGPCAAAGTFTTNRVCAAPVKWDRALLPSDAVRAVVINAGNANAATGAEGDANARRTAVAAAARLGCRTEEVLVASTGVIGHQLPMDALLGGLERVLGAASEADESFHEASRAILTTDTKPKVVAREERIGSQAVRLLGIAKGAAMIGPKMATMLAFFLTDALVAPRDLQAILSEAVEQSFNCISVEGHMSTNDTVLLLASGAAGGRPSRGERSRPSERSSLSPVQRAPG